MLFGQGVDDLLRFFFFADGQCHPDIFQHVRDLAKQAKDVLQAAGEQLVDAVFDRIFVAKL